MVAVRERGELRPVDPVPAAEVLSDEDRSAIYQWFSGLFAWEPTPASLTTYRRVEGRLLLDWLRTQPSLAPLIERLDRICATQQSCDRSVAELSRSFGRLFLGVAGRRSVPPYESVYYGENARLFQAPAGWMSAFIVRLDLRVAEGFSEPPDHLAIELSVMSALARRRVEAPDETARAESLTLQRDFLDQRLLSWIDRFAEDCAVADPGGFYATAAACLADFLRVDAAALAAQER